MSWDDERGQQSAEQREGHLVLILQLKLQGLDARGCTGQVPLQLHPYGIELGSLLAPLI